MREGRAETFDQALRALLEERSRGKRGGAKRLADALEIAKSQLHDMIAGHVPKQRVASRMVNSLPEPWRARLERAYVESARIDAEAGLRRSETARAAPEPGDELAATIARLNPAQRTGLAKLAQAMLTTGEWDRAVKWVSDALGLMTKHFGKGDSPSANVVDAG